MKIPKDIEETDKDTKRHKKQLIKTPKDTKETKYQKHIGV